MSTQQVSKICHRCGRDVAGQPREKDAEGRYFCLPCGEAERTQQMYRESGICEGCGESPGQAALVLLAGQNLCPACRRRKFKYGIDKSKSKSSGGLLGTLKSLFRR